MPNESPQPEKSARGTSLAMQQAAAEILRRLPEFQTRSEERIQAVSKALALALANAAKYRE